MKNRALKRMYPLIYFSSVYHIKRSCTLMKESDYLNEMIHIVGKDVCNGKDKM